MADGNTGLENEEHIEAPARPPFEEAFPVRVRRTGEAMEEVARLLLGDANQLGFTEMRILAYLDAVGSASGGEISRYLQLDNAWISRRLQALRRRSLIVQVQDPSDRRAIRTSLTDAGRALCRRSLFDIARCHRAIMDGLDERLSIEMVERLERNLRSVARRLRAQDKSVLDY